MDAGRIDAILTALRARSETCEDASRCIDYLTRKRLRRRISGVRAEARSVSSGVVGAGCKHAVGTRLKRAGMRWTVAGADLRHRPAVLQALSGRFEDFRERRAANAISQ